VGWVEGVDRAVPGRPVAGGGDGEVEWLPPGVDQDEEVVVEQGRAVGGPVGFVGSMHLIDALSLHAWIRSPIAGTHNYAQAATMGDTRIFSANTVNSIRLYRKAQLALFVSLTALYDLPLGYDEMFVYNLARRLAGLSGRSLLPDDQALARNSLRAVKVSNVKIVTLEADPMLVQNNQRRWFNIIVGE
jgi:hypothetical protein